MGDSQNVFPFFAQTSDAEGSSSLSKYIPPSLGKGVPQIVSESKMDRSSNSEREYVLQDNTENFSRNERFNRMAGIRESQNSGFFQYARDKEFPKPVHSNHNENLSLDFIQKNLFPGVSANAHGYESTRYEVETLQLLPTLAVQDTEFPRSSSAPPSAPNPGMLEKFRPNLDIHGIHAHSAFPTKQHDSSSLLQFDNSRSKKSKSKEAGYSSIAEKASIWNEDDDETAMDIVDEDDYGEDMLVNEKPTKRKTRATGLGSISKSDSEKATKLSPHLLTERRRREKLNAQFLALRGVVPNITKMNKLSTLEDAIIYIKSLKEKITDLEDRIKSSRYQDAENMDKAMTMRSDAHVTVEYDSNDSSPKDCSQNLYTESSKTPMDIEIAAVGKENLSMRMVCGERKGLIADIGAALELSSMDVHHLSLMKCSDSYYVNVISSQVENNDEIESLEKSLSNLLFSPLRATSILSSKPSSSSLS